VHDTIRGRISFAAMSSGQWFIVGLCILLNMVDGMDVLVLSYIAPVIAAEWGLSPREVGWLFSAGLLGMMVGCLAIAPQADRLGRRPILLASLLLNVVGLSGAAMAGTIYQLLLARFVTGLGVGGILPAIAAIAMEFSSEERKNLNVSLVQAGWPLGALLTGWAASHAIATVGYRGYLWYTALASAFLFLLMTLRMPESIELLDRRRPAGALGRINRVLKQLRKEPLPELPPASSQLDRQGWPVVRLLSGEHGQVTWRLWVGTFFAFTTLYTLISWVPSFARSAGVSLDQAIHAGTVLNLGALAGTIAIGIVSRWIGLRRFALLALSSAIIFMLVFSQSSINGVIGLPLIFLIGATVQGGFNSFYPIATRSYPPELRASGVGYAMGIGRAGAVAGPLLAGYLLASGVPMARLFIVFSVPLAVSALAVGNTRLGRSGRSRDIS
jgi:MFS transporter, AAHS family, 4-hydroxybenzoate transporter